MQRTAVFWIRDGVLIDRMPVNAVGFAVASLSHTNSNVLTKTDLTSLVNFAFQTSGISCADKMRKFNSENLPLVSDVAAAVNYYNELTGHAASQCSYFDGACELVKHLRGLGVLNFITSAVEQSALDSWAQSAQANLLVPHLTEILGKRSDRFGKGKHHFAHAHDHYGVERIFYIADAVAEISTGAQFSQEFNILPVGFAHVITSEKIRQAHNLVIDAHAALSAAQKAPESVQNLVLDESRLCLPDEMALVQSLKDAKATYVVSGNAGTIMAGLAAYLETCGVLPQKEVSNG